MQWNNTETARFGHLTFLCKPKQTSTEIEIIDKRIIHFYFIFYPYQPCYLWEWDGKN